MYTKGKICLHIVQRGCDLQCLENIQGCEVNLNNRGYKIFIVGNACVKHKICGFTAMLNCSIDNLIES
jgi:hypothetical protein